jgi:glycosyltransferase involved in cell wall biosynthesis
MIDDSRGDRNGASPLRVAVNTLSVVPLRTGGGETYLVNLLRRMADQKNVRLLLLVSNLNEGLFADFPRETTRLMRVPLAGRSVGLRLLAEHVILPRLCARWGADVLFAPGNSIPFLTTGPTVLAIQSMHYSIVPEQMSPLRVAYFSRMVPLAGRRASRVVAVSADIARRLARVAGIGPNRIRVVYEGFDPSFKRVTDEGVIADTLARHGIPRPFLLFVSSLNIFKNPDKAIRAFAALDRPDLHLVIVGRDNTGMLAQWQELVRSLGVENRVRFMGFVPNNELPALYSSAECMLYPSAVETFGLPPLEAMGCGLPVVASNRTSVPEIVGDAALCVDPDDTDALAAAIARVLDEPDLRRDLAARGQRRLGRFCWTRAARETLEVLRDAAGRDPVEGAP